MNAFTVNCFFKGDICKKNKKLGENINKTIIKVNLMGEKSHVSYKFYYNVILYQYKTFTSNNNCLFSKLEGCFFNFWKY